MIKLISVICVSLALVSSFYYFKTITLESKNCLLESEKTAFKLKSENLEKSIEEYNRKKMEASSTIIEIRERIKYVKDVCDCYNTSIPNVVIDVLQSNKSRAY